MQEIDEPLTDWPGWCCGAALSAAAIAAYGGALFVPLLYDDIPSISGNPTIQHLRTALFPPPALTVTGRPVLNLSFAANFAVSGTGVWSYHALNLAIHLLAGLALFGIVRRTLTPRMRSGGTSVAFSTALIWTLHPLQTESVTYIVQRAESLMGLFYLLTLYCLIRGAGAQRPLQVLWYSASVSFCLLGMGTKEVMVSAPLIVFLYDRAFLAGSFAEAWRSRRGFYCWLAGSWVPLGLLVASTGGNRGSNTIGLGTGASWHDYLLTQFPAVCHYLRLCFWPHPLIFDYGPFWVSRPAAVWPQVLTVLLLAGATLWGLLRRPALGWLGCWFFAILAPTSLVPGTTQMIVEHRMYLALAPVAILAAVGIHRWLGRMTVPLCLILAAALLTATRQRNRDYASAESLWGDTVAKRPDNERARLNLGIALAGQPERLQDAISQFEAAIRLKPDFAEAHFLLGYALRNAFGPSDDATREIREAVRLNPDLAKLPQLPGAGN